MDTREKIVSLQQLPSRLGAHAWLAVTGSFDPLTLAHAEHFAALAAHGKTILAVVDPNPTCLLPADARAVLVAALKTVRLVVIAEPSTLPPQIQVLRDDATDRQLSRAFIEHVRSRQRPQ